MIDRLLRSADFERVLRTSSHVRSVHFAVHHLRDAPSKPSRPVRASQRKLSTGQPPEASVPVDDTAGTATKPLPEATLPAVNGLWLGAVVPKRHARRAVTRNLLKRQIRAAVTGQQHRLAQGLWVVRLRAPFDKALFPSAASSVLQLAARNELDQLLTRAAQR